MMDRGRNGCEAVDKRDICMVHCVSVGFGVYIRNDYAPWTAFCIYFTFCSAMYVHESI